MSVIHAHYDDGSVLDIRCPTWQLRSRLERLADSEEVVYVIVER